MTAATGARAAFLRALAADGFVPEGDAVAAVNAATGAELPGEPTADPVRDAVEEFARGYWTYDPDERARRWKELSTRCGRNDRAAVARLAHLKPGLGVVAQSLSDPMADALAEKLRELYALPPRDRAVRRSEWLAERDPESPEWVQAVRQVRRDVPELIALEPDLTRRLTQAPMVRRTRRFRFADTPREPEESKPRAAFQLPGCFFMVIAYVVLRGIFGGLGSSSYDTTPSYTPPPYTAPNTQFEPNSSRLKQSSLFTAAEVREFKNYEAKLMSGLVPKRYSTWVALGRPEAVPPPPGKRP